MNLSIRVNDEELENLFHKIIADEINLALSLQMHRIQAVIMELEKSMHKFPELMTALDTLNHFRGVETMKAEQAVLSNPDLEAAMAKINRRGFLSKEQRRIIAERYIKGESPTDLAKEFGVSLQSIYNYRIEVYGAKKPRPLKVLTAPIQRVCKHCGLSKDTFSQLGKFVCADCKACEAKKVKTE